MRFAQLSTLACVLLLASFARAQNSPSETVFIYFGEPDPTGVDQSFLALGRRRGAQVARETPGQLAARPLGAELARAVVAYSQLRFAEAIEIVDGLEREVVARGGGGLTRGELVDLHAYRAAARMASGDEAGAWDDLLSVAVMGASRPLDPARFSPRVVEAARRAAQTVGAPARLVVSAAPDDALIIVDGELLGRGRVELSLPTGAHLIRAERSGFQAAGRAVALGAAGAETRLELAPLAPPSTELLATRASALGAKRAVAAYVTASGGRAAVELLLIDAPRARIDSRTRLTDDERLTTGDLIVAVDSLLPLASDGVTIVRRPPWYRRPLVWGLVGGAAAACALGVGLGVGLTQSRPSGFTVRVDLGSLR